MTVDKIGEFVVILGFDKNKLIEWTYKYTCPFELKIVELITDPQDVDVLIAQDVTILEVDPDKTKISTRADLTNKDYPEDFPDDPSKRIPTITKSY